MTNSFSTPPVKLLPRFDEICSRLPSKEFIHHKKPPPNLSSEKAINFRNQLANLRLAHLRIGTDGFPLVP